MVVCVLFLLLVVAARSWAADPEPDAAPAAVRRNIVLIVCDDLRPALQAYGDWRARTPNMDALAERSFVFTGAYAQQSLCAPSRNSMLTSRRPDTLHLYDFYSYWRHAAGNFTTLPQHLKQHGYTTRSFGKIFHPGASSNHTDDYPYSWSVPAFHSTTERFMNWPLCPDSRTGRLQRNVICPVDVHEQPHRILPDEDNVRQARQFLLEQRQLQQPFFLAVGLHKPHIPLRFPRHFLHLHQPLERFAQPAFAYVPHDLPAVAFAPFTDIRERQDARAANISWPFGPVPEDFGRRLRQAYYAACSYADRLVGELLAAVDMRQTVVLLTSDHGWSLGEHADWAKYSNFEVALRVPLLVSAPHLGGGGGKRVERLVELLDVFPTLVQLAGAGVAPLPRCRRRNQLGCVEGRSLVPLMMAAAAADGRSVASAPDDAAYSQYPRPAQYPQADSDRPRLRHIRTMGYTMRTPAFRYTSWQPFDGRRRRPDWRWLQRQAEELYDERWDAAEMCNLAGREELAAVRRRLWRRLRRKFAEDG